MTKPNERAAARQSAEFNMSICPNNAQVSEVTLTNGIDGSPGGDDGGDGGAGGSGGGAGGAGVRGGAGGATGGSGAPSVDKKRVSDAWRISSDDRPRSHTTTSDTAKSDVS